MDKRIRIAGIAGAIIFAIVIWTDILPSNPPPIPEPITSSDTEFVQVFSYQFGKTLGF